MDLTSPRLAALIERRDLVEEAIGQLYELKRPIVEEILAERSRLYAEDQRRKAAAHYAALEEEARTDGDGAAA